MRVMFDWLPGGTNTLRFRIEKEKKRKKERKKIFNRVDNSHE